MILIDANLLIYAHVSSFKEHKAARTWLDGTLSGPTRVGLPWESLTAFVRLVSNPRIFERPASISDAWRQVEDWLDAPTTWVPQPEERHRDLLSGLIPHCSSSNLIPDAHLAAIALEHGLRLCSTDGDFARFPDLMWENPLLGNGA
ncbi:MAG: type II toxin-antitoxin system VapC family toxin [Verrucomicrobia bacterium]|nr:type II toxin-antitoxin system VapC family toxin [Kiritimatiellia bacterium]MCP5487752.1 type II toxin-antitoxin system VapC family toxin [Verrucomicrobiota bacterium]